MPDEEPDEPMTEQKIRAELGEILDHLQSLPSDAFAEKFKLRKRQEELTRLLQEIEIPGAEEIQERWTQAAVDKADGEEPEEMVISPTLGSAPN